LSEGERDDRDGAATVRKQDNHEDKSKRINKDETHRVGRGICQTSGGRRICSHLNRPRGMPSKVEAKILREQDNYKRRLGYNDQNGTYKAQGGI
jgi:hypothetical protein